MATKKQLEDFVRSQEPIVDGLRRKLNDAFLEWTHATLGVPCGPNQEFRDAVLAMGMMRFIQDHGMQIVGVEPKEEDHSHLTSFMFEMGDSTVGPVGFTARVLAKDKAEAVELLRKAMPEHSDLTEELEDVDPTSEQRRITFDVYFNSEAITVDDAKKEDGEEYICEGCKKTVDEESAIWLNPETKEATSGPAGRAYHIACNPSKKEVSRGDE